MAFGLSRFLTNESNHLCGVCQVRVGILPTTLDLIHNGTSSTFASVHCFEDAETVSHVLWSCDFAVLAWRGSRFKVDQVVSFQEVVHCVLKIYELDTNGYVAH